MTDFDEKDLPVAFDGLPTRTYMQVGELVIPRAASIAKGSTLFDPAATIWGPQVDIFLDGSKLSEVVSFDVDAGKVRVHRLVNGRVVVEHDEIASDILTGKVEIRLREPEA